MKIVHVALTDGGGAGKGMLNLHHALLAQGIDSWVLVAHKRSNDERIVEMRPNHHLWGTSRWIQMLQRAACRIGVCLNDYDHFHHRIFHVRKTHPVFFTQPLSQYNILNHPLVKEADILHLHFVAEFVDYPSFFPNVKQPVVWTIRDEEPGLGGFHFREAKQRFGAPYASLEEAFFKIKREAVEQCKALHLVSLSNVVKAFCQNVDYLASRPNTVIPNTISPADFQLINKAQARLKLGLKADSIVLSFVSCHLSEERKGLHLVLQALKILNDKRIHLLCVGHRDASIADAPNVHFFGSISDTSILSTIYSASTLFVNASVQETFGKTIVEALYCGTPVVTTSVGIAPEVITPNNGCILPARSAEALSKALRESLTHSFSAPKAIRQGAIRIFDAERVAKQHIQLYTSMLR